MARPPIENCELPSACRWERTRQAYFHSIGQHELAEEIGISAHWLEQRLSTLLEGQLQ